ncbi:MAG: DNA replication/repair protein RecF [Chloroflexi bacterium]|nr:DNA replication/repair protein RecF [Chloroflexota bacterium]
MFIKHLSLTNFRNFVRLELDLTSEVTVLQGDNAQGKTNLLEAIYYLATTRSPRTSSDRLLINWLADEEDLPYSRLVAEVQRAGMMNKIEIAIAKEANDAEPQRMVLRKRVRLNGANKRAADILGQLNAVLFMPEDIDLVGGTASLRRHCLDDALSQIDPAYYRYLRRYTRVVSQRNVLLRLIRDGRAGRDELEFWDQNLVRYGSVIIARREQAVQHLNTLVTEVHSALTGAGEHLRLEYLCSVPRLEPAHAGYQIPLLNQDLGLIEWSELDAVAHAIADQFTTHLLSVREQEIARGVSLVGPHRDDLRFLVNGVDMKVFGSRGQQRTVTLSFKLAEVRFMHLMRGEMPVLLLDDVISELDATRRGYLMNTINQAQQVIMTTTDLAPYSPQFLRNASLLQVCGGRLRPLSLP